MKRHRDTFSDLSFSVECPICRTEVPKMRLTTLMFIGAQGPAVLRRVSVVKSHKRVRLHITTTRGQHIRVTSSSGGKRCSALTVLSAVTPRQLTTLTSSKLTSRHRLAAVTSVDGRSLTLPSCLVISRCIMSKTHGVRGPDTQRYLRRGKNC